LDDSKLNAVFATVMCWKTTFRFSGYCIWVRKCNSSWHIFVIPVYNF